MLYVTTIDSTTCHDLSRHNIICHDVLQYVSTRHEMLRPTPILRHATTQYNRPRQNYTICHDMLQYVPARHGMLHASDPVTFLHSPTQNNMSRPNTLQYATTRYNISRHIAICHDNHDMPPTRRQNHSIQHDTINEGTRFVTLTREKHPFYTKGKHTLCHTSSRYRAR